jgi:hypothetical protein
VRPNILLNRRIHPVRPGFGRRVSSPSRAPACKLQAVKKVDGKSSFGHRLN